MCRVLALVTFYCTSSIIRIARGQVKTPKHLDGDINKLLKQIYDRIELASHIPVVYDSITSIDSIKSISISENVSFFFVATHTSE